MSRLLKITVISLIIFGFAGWCYAVKEYYNLLAIPHMGPRAVITLSLDSEPQGFKDGQFYILKVLKVYPKEMKVDLGLCRLEVTK